VASAVLHNGTTIGILLNALAGVSQAPGIGAQARARVEQLKEVVGG
jgi:hypothetical protein